MLWTVRVGARVGYRDVGNGRARRAGAERQEENENHGDVILQTRKPKTEDPGRRLERRPGRQANHAQVHHTERAQHTRAGQALTPSLETHA